ncbi:energy transducer TonB [Algoriphagus chordae]|uniref:TonB family protein n=1 Tax=Algoriphagus chordae TaxID=237019 RepID=A0A2W7QEB8_9BACT|nr:energy transducer TonB [Algoriphagus chordae]PZX46868.1 TonB family protein [Algoriphagus chordae]
MRLQSRTASILFFLTLTLAAVSQASIAQEKEIVLLNEYFYPIEKSDSSDYVYKSIITQINDSSSVEYIFTRKNQLIKNVRQAYNAEGKFFEKLTETYDQHGKLTSKKTTNLDNTMYHAAYYQDEQYLGEVIYKGPEQFETRKAGTADVLMLNANEFEPTPSTDKLLWQKHLMKKLRYPPHARTNRETGTVMLAVHVNSNGIKTKITIANPASVDESLAEEALRVARSYEGRFMTAVDLDGNPIDGILLVPIRFKLS